jgi:transposase
MASLQKKNVKGIDYYSIVESRRINGKPVPTVIEYIGNRKKLYERLARDPLKEAKVKSRRHGDVHALLSVASALGVAETIDRIFGRRDLRDGKVSRGTALVLAAIHRACSPAGKNAFADWYNQTTLDAETGIKGDVMTSQLFWEQMDGITESELAAAEDEINAKILSRYDVTPRRLALDYTNYYSFIATGNASPELAQRGRNKQKRSDLRQYSLAAVTTPELCVPLVTHVYPGNRGDVTEFAEYAKILKKRLGTDDPENLTLVFDGGSVSGENLFGLGAHFICSFSLSRCKALFEVENDEYAPLDVGGKTTRAHSETLNVWGMDLKCVVRLSDELLVGQTRELDGDAEEAASAIDKLVERLRNPRSRIDRSVESVRGLVDKILSKGHLREFVEAVVAVSGDEAVDVSLRIDDDKREAAIEKFFGKSLTVTDRLDWTTAEILSAYAEQDNIEKIFRGSKDRSHCALQPIYHWTDQKVRVHVFICMLAVTLTRVLQRELADRGAEVSCDGMLDELAKVRKSWILVRDENKEEDGASVRVLLEEMEPGTERLWNMVNEIG